VIYISAKCLQSIFMNVYSDIYMCICTSHLCVTGLIHNAKTTFIQYDIFKYQTTYIYIYIYTYTHTLIWVYIQILIYALSIYIYTYVFIYMYIHTHTHTYSLCTDSSWRWTRLFLARTFSWLVQILATKFTTCTNKWTVELSFN